MNAHELALARWLARKAVKARWHKQGRKHWDYEARELATAARSYLSEHHELIEQAKVLLVTLK